MGLFRLALNKDASVRDCWNNGWHLVWSRNVSNGTNANLLTNLLSLLQNTILNDSDDVWVWYSGNSTFTVKDARGKIDDGFLPDDGLETRWNRFLQKRSTFLFGGLSVIAFLPVGISVEEESRSPLLLALLVITGSIRLITQCGSALLLLLFGFGFLNGWTLVPQIFPT
ncbi:hypothetical protein Tco_0112975, partial [Tanacetum coccineum]